MISTPKAVSRSSTSVSPSCARRLRRRWGRRNDPDHDPTGRGDGHGSVHEPRAGPRQGGRPPQRHLLHRGRPLSDGHRTAALLRFDTDRDHHRDRAIGSRSPSPSSARRRRPSSSGSSASAWKRTPSRRYQSARELAVDLDNLKRDTESGVTVTAPEPRRARPGPRSAGMSGRRCGHCRRRLRVHSLRPVDDTRATPSSRSPCCRSKTAPATPSPSISATV